ncbi:MAG TPA: sigma-70 family RNA polymerase sigma factor [Planctomycetota bacterium]|jgi:RNA polymerase sigma-70 factor (ECF subfamily)|nr:sigma-70 family RNA polymerase sigma factor [Planctomycetota bacterium]
MESGAFSAEGQARVTQLLMKHRAELFAYLMAAVRNLHDAEDLLQDVSLAASASWSQYRPGTPFLPWAREIARRRILHYGKRRGRRPALLEPGVLEQLDRAAADSEEPLDPRRAALRKCLEELGSRGRRILEMRYGDKLDVPRIADVLGRTVQAAYALLKRTKQILRECVQRRLSAPAPGK